MALTLSGSLFQSLSFPTGAAKTRRDATVSRGLRTGKITVSSPARRDGRTAIVGSISVLAGQDLPGDYGSQLTSADSSWRRRAGVLLHPSSLPGAYGIGDFGDEAIRFLDWLHSTGCSVWQVLPLVPPGRKSNEDGSPYAGQDANCGNTLLISLEELVKDGLLMEDELPEPMDMEKVQFATVADIKDPLITKEEAASRDGEKTEMAQPIRFGILGCARIARKVSRAIKLSPNATIVSVGSRSAEKARRFIDDNGLSENTRAHGSYESLLDDPEVDAVYVPLPTSLHLRWATEAARKGKHVLLEKPTALCVAELDQILEACEANNVQFMDGTMWMHHPRTAKMHDLIRDSDLFGQLKMVSSIACFLAEPDFLHNNIRANPDLDALGALGDVGWYCIRLILWSADYRMPRTALALPNPAKTEAGLLLSCGASLHWDDGTVATFYCSFLAHRTFEVAVVGSKATLTLSDFINPFQENSARFTFASTDHVVPSEPPQEVCMISEFSRLVGAVRDNSGSKPDKRWPSIARKTQVVLDAVKASFDEGFQPIQIAAN